VVRRNEHGGVTELLVPDLQLADTQPQGAEHPPLADWAVVVCPAAGQSEDPRDWVLRVQPRPAQLLVVALLGLGRDRQGWNGVVVQGGEAHVLARLRVVGPHMLNAVRENLGTADELAAEGLRRWSRTRGALGDRVWRKVRSASLAVFGVSRTGSILAFHLAALGVRRLLLVDPDTIEDHNLDSMWGAAEADVGNKKVDAVAHQLSLFRSDLAIQGFGASAADPRVVDLVRRFDLLATCADSDTPRLAAALLAERLLKTHLDIGTGVTGADSDRLIAADVRLLLPGQGCVCCVGGLSDEDEARYELLAPAGALRRSRQRQWRQERAGSLITINTMAAAVAVQLWLDLLAGHLRTSHWTRLRWRPGQGLEVNEGPVSAADNCRICQARRPS
jgi:molybdopterin/thiamine biosynthesis adenylyltransferase